MRRRLHLAAALLFGLGAAGPLQAHDHRAGAVRIGHPFATPSLAGTRNGAAYIATLENTGAKPDRLLRASTPVAERVELHTMALDAGGVMRMREVGEIALAPKAQIRMRPGQGFHLMLIGLRRPLKDGETFPLTLEFEHGGKVESKFVVQVPRAGAPESHGHKH